MMTSIQTKLAFSVFSVAPVTCKAPLITITWFPSSFSAFSSSKSSFLSYAATKVASSVSYEATSHRSHLIRADAGAPFNRDLFHKEGHLSYGEQSRMYRRTIYQHNDWVKHRSSDRFLNNLQTMLRSGVYKNIEREIWLLTGFAAFVCVFNMVVGGYTDFGGVAHPPGIQSILLPVLRLPMAPLTLASPALGLLLVFQTNTSYERWDEARKNWGMNINHTRDLVRMATTYYDSRGVSLQQRQDDLNHVALCTWAFVRAMKRQLSSEHEDEEAFRKELLQKLPEKQAQMIINAAHRPNWALQDLSFAVDNLPMHFSRKNEIHKSITIFEDNLGSSERIFSSPVPIFYSRHLTRFLFLWLATVPLTLYEPFTVTWNHIGMVPATSLLSLFLLGIEELGTQMEEPFTILPMQSFCDKIYSWCMEIVSRTPGDNGREVKSIKEEHAYFPVISINNMEEHQHTKTKGNSVVDN